MEAEDKIETLNILLLDKVVLSSTILFSRQRRHKVTVCYLTGLFVYGGLCSLIPSFTLYRSTLEQQW